MRHILVYSDSLSWGIIPNTRQRLDFDQRWPGVLENVLSQTGERIRVVEDCLNGRRTVWNDPFKEGRDGSRTLSQRVEIHSPLSLVILMLGTNDFQFCHPFNDAWAASQGMGVLVDVVRNAPIEPGMPIPAVLIVSPPAIRKPRGPIAPKFQGAEERSRGLSAHYADVAEKKKCFFFDAETVTSSSITDGIHLDRDQHLKLGKGMAVAVQAILNSSENNAS